MGLGIRASPSHALGRGGIMKKLLLSGVAFVGLAAAPALAADLSTAPLYRAPPPVPVFTWTGCYIGGSVGGGYAWNTNTNTVSSAAARSAATISSRASSSAWKARTLGPT